MSWLSIPLSNPFKSLNFSDDDDDDGVDDDDHHQKQEFDRTEIDAGAGVKEDLLAIGDSISRRFRGVSAFLAPPSTAASSSSAVEGIRSDLAEIGGTFKSTLSLFSNPNKAVSEISKFASDFLQLNEENSENFDGDDDHVKNDGVDDDDDDYEDEEEDEDEEEYGAGVTDEVIEFARQISDRSELWIDFPLPLDHLGFDMSDAQSEHASIVEQLIPSLADLKNKISNHKSEQHFWMIYFILLLPRLNDDDLELLSTPQIVEARETLLMMVLPKKDKEINSETSQSYNSSALDDKAIAEPEKINSVEETTVFENPNSPIKESNEANIIEKLPGVEDTSTVSSAQCYPLDAKADDPDLSKSPSSAAPKAHEYPKRFQTEDDVSFSDLEEDDEDSDHRKRDPYSGSSQIKRNSSTEGSTDWVRLNEGTRESHVRGQSSTRERDSEGEESTDWLTVDDFDP